jgi:hypothetical protein
MGSGLQEGHPYEDVIRALAEDPKPLFIQYYGEDATPPGMAGPCVWVQTRSQLEALVQVLEEEQEIGVDIEHHHVRSFRGFTSLVQVPSTSGRHFLDFFFWHCHVVGSVLPLLWSFTGDFENATDFDLHNRLSSGRNCVAWWHAPSSSNLCQPSYFKGTGLNEETIFKYFFRFCCQFMWLVSGRDLQFMLEMWQIFHGADSDSLWLQRDFHIYIVNLFDTARVSATLPCLCLKDWCFFHVPLKSTLKSNGVLCIGLWCFREATKIVGVFASVILWRTNQQSIPGTKTIYSSFPAVPPNSRYLWIPFL